MRQSEVRIRYTISVGEGGEHARLEVDGRRLSAAGITLEELRAIPDGISVALVSKIISDQAIIRPGILSCMVG